MKILLVCFLILVVGACAGLKAPSNSGELERKSLTLEEFQKEQEERSKILSQVQGKARIRYASSKHSLFGEVRFNRFLENARFEVRDPMGRIRLWVINDAEGLLAYEDDSRTAWKAAPKSDSYLKKLYGIRLTWEEIQDLWGGILPKSWREKMGSEWRWNSGQYEGALTSGEKRIRFQVDPNSRQVTQVLLETGKQLTQLDFNDWDACSALEAQKSLLAHRVVVNLLNESSKFELEWEELSLLEKNFNPWGFKRELPKGTRLVSLDGQKGGFR